MQSAKQPSSEKKKIDIYDYFQVGMFIDAKDTINKWCVAIVKEVNESQRTISFHFDGWPSKWDDVRSSLWTYKFWYRVDRLAIWMPLIFMGFKSSWLDKKFICFEISLGYFTFKTNC